MFSYESIKKYFADQKNIRADYKADILSIAIEKERRGYKAINSIPVQAFWKSYYEFKDFNYEVFRMNKPGVVPYNSDWIQLFSERLKGALLSIISSKKDSLMLRLKKRQI